jgi:uncharacterized protein YndB with AHSA1/START domain
MSDRIEKKVLLRAPRSRVWRAIEDKTEFGTWFKVDFPPGTFTVGETVSGQITYPGYEHLTMEVDVVEVTPEEQLSFRWVPGIDPSIGTQTLVTFRLEDVADGTMLTVTETGFEQFPPDLREKVYRENEGGWTEQMQMIERHVTAS